MKGMCLLESGSQPLVETRPETRRACPPDGFRCLLSNNLRPQFRCSWPLTAHFHRQAYLTIHFSITRNVPFRCAIFLEFIFGRTVLRIVTSLLTLITPYHSSWSRFRATTRVRFEDDFGLQILNTRAFTTSISSILCLQIDPSNSLSSIPAL